MGLPICVNVLEIVTKSSGLFAPDSRVAKHAVIVLLASIAVVVVTVFEDTTPLIEEFPVLIVWGDQKVCRIAGLWRGHASAKVSPSLQWT